jgi:hypothetical protein
MHTPSSGPPENELPAIVDAPEAVWRGDGVVFAIPSLQVYTTGAELQIIYRTSGAHPRTPEQSRQTTEALRNLTVNGRHVALLRGSHYDHGFNYQAWTSFSGAVPDGMTLTLEWPGIDDGPRLVSGIRDAAQRVRVLW